MKTSVKGLGILENFEGLSLKPYYCPAGKATIGFGSTYYEDGTKVRISDSPITIERAKALKLNALKVFEVGVLKKTKVYLNQEMFDALVCFCYNLGLSNFQVSTLRMKLNRGEYSEVYTEFLRWNKVNGKTYNGLVKRRKAEADLFNQGLDIMMRKEKLTSKHIFPKAFNLLSIFKF